MTFPGAGAKLPGSKTEIPGNRGEIPGSAGLPRSKAEIPGTRAELPGDQGWNLLVKERKGEKNRRDVGMQLFLGNERFGAGNGGARTAPKTCKKESKEER